MRYVLARYGAYPNVIWCLVNEWNYSVLPQDYWNQMGRFVQAEDPWSQDVGRPRALSIHQQTRPDWLADFFNTGGLEYWKMTPHNELVTGTRVYLLAEPDRQYIVFVAAGGEFKIKLGPGRYLASRFNPATGEGVSLGTVDGGERVIPLPAGHDWAVRLVCPRADPTAAGAEEPFPLWDDTVPLPTAAETPVLEHVRFSRIKQREPEVDGFHWLHGVAIVRHKGRLFTNVETGWIGEITILHLATQTAGFEKPGGYTKLIFEPGTKWSYSDGGPNWLAECVTLAYRQDVDKLMFDRVFTPLGITRDDLAWRNNSYRDREIDGIPRREFGSGISANVDAMARVGLLYLRNGVWNGRRILPEDFVKQAGTTVPAVVGLPEVDPQIYGNASDHYGLLWWNNADGTLNNVPRDTYWTWGLYDSLIVVIPSLDMVVARAGQSWKRNSGDDHYAVLEPFLGPLVAAAAKPEKEARVFNRSRHAANASPFAFVFALPQQDDWPQQPVVEPLDDRRRYAGARWEALFLGRRTPVTGTGSRGRRETVPLPGRRPSLSPGRPAVARPLRDRVGGRRLARPSRPRYRHPYAAD